MKDNNQIAYTDYIEYPREEMKKRANTFYKELIRRRSIRDFSERKIPLEIIRKCILAAASAPNGANMQPWHFVIVSDKKVKREIRNQAEKIEHAFYKKAPEEWLKALAILNTHWQKPFLETAPYLIIIFAQNYGIQNTHDKIKHYYVKESVGIATGFLITTLHHCGLSTLVYTPSPMRFLNHICKRPKNETPFAILVVGYPKENAKVPLLKRRTLVEITTII